MVGYITGIGSCRIIPPPRLGIEKRGLLFNQVRNYGFVHSSAEAVQQIRFMIGDFNPSPEVWPLIAPKAQLDELLQETHNVSDVYVVEISSLKKITLDDHVLQLNYFARVFPGIMGDPENKKQFWSLARTGDQSRMDAFLSEQVRARNIDPDEADILRGVRLKQMTVDDVRSDVRWIIDTLPRVIFQTHVDAQLPDGTASPARRRLIDTIKHAVSAEGGTFYDPTSLMLDWGQDKSMNQNSTAHWTDAFSDALFDNLWARHLSHGLKQAE